MIVPGAGHCVECPEANSCHPTAQLCPEAVLLEPAVEKGVRRTKMEMENVSSHFAALRGQHFT